MSYYVITKTVGDILTHVKRQFGDEAGVQIVDADIIRWINGAQLDIGTRNKVIKATGTTNVVAAQSEYDLTALKVIAIESVHYKGTPLLNMELAQAEQRISKVDPDGTVTGDPELWYEWAGIVTLWPTPTENVNSGIKVYFTKAPTLVDSSDDLLSLPDKYYEAVLAYVMEKAYELDEDYQAAQVMHTRYLEHIDARSEEERSSAQITYPLITIVE